MKVLLITGSFPPMRCGVGDYTHQLALTLARVPGVVVAVLTSRAAASFETHAAFEFFPIVEAWNWSEVGPILKTIRSWSPDLVHIQYPTQGYLGKPLPWLPWLLPLHLRLAGISVVQTWHEIYSPWRELYAQGFILRLFSKAIVPGGLVVVREGYQQRVAVSLRWIFLNKTVRFIPNASAVPAIELNADERRALRAKYARPDARLIAFFGFIHPIKRIELLFQIADSRSSHLVIIGDSFRKEDLGSYPESIVARVAAYHHSLRQLAETEAWKGKVTMTGFISAREAACIIAAADAVVLPFTDGGGEWNTSIHAAQVQGTFVLTTSRKHVGYEANENTYFASPHDLEDMGRALKKYIGIRSEGRDRPLRTWQSIGQSHVDLYQTQLSRKQIYREL
jgi:glycosyltransferase involved in cell wall biosynthesis